MVRSRRVVVITGCDSGIGLLSATALRDKGYVVIATYLTDSGLIELKGIASVSIKCDLTRADNIKKLEAEVICYLQDNPDLYLWAIVNNAGIVSLAYVDWAPIDSFRSVMEVNFLALVSVTKAFLPLLKKTRGSRIINVSSMAGLAGSPLMAAYTASKHAVEGFSKCIRMELRPWGIYVCNVNPGYMKTPMVLNAVTPTMDCFMNAPENVKECYGHRSIGSMVTGYHNCALAFGEDPIVVVHCIRDLLEAHSPAALNNYPGCQARIFRVLLWLLPMWLLELLSARDVVGPATPQIT